MRVILITLKTELVPLNVMLNEASRGHITMPSVCGSYCQLYMHPDL